MMATQSFAWVIALASFLLVLGLGNLLAVSMERASQSRRAVETMSDAASIRAHVERELNSFVALQNGLGGYLAVRHDTLDAKEVSDILAVLHRSVRHVRNVGVAEGYQLKYMYPIAGNEQAIGLDYRRLPEQWPAIQQIVATGRPALVGPVQLVQGGRGLIYRAPLMVDDKYWGMMSTVVDSDSLFKEVSDRARETNFTYAIRSRSVLGMESKPVIGDQSLFNHPAAVVLDFDVPGGHWSLAVEKFVQGNGMLPRMWRVTGLLLGLLLAIGLYLLLRHRGELAHLVRYDALTGLPNRRFLEERHTLLNARFRRGSQTPCALLFVDLDDFKEVNDRHGHRSGDAVLQTIANRMRRIMRADDIVVRWGGDEFIALVEGIREDDMEAFVARLHDIIEEPMQLGDHGVQVGASIGVAMYPPGGAAFDEMIRLADLDMYEDKSVRKNGAG